MCQREQAREGGCVYVGVCRYKEIEKKCKIQKKKQRKNERFIKRKKKINILQSKVSGQTKKERKKERKTEKLIHKENE